MAQTIKLKRSATSGAVPTTGSLELGEVAINTYDGKMYIKKNDGTESVVEIGASSEYLPLSGGTLTGNLDVNGTVVADGLAVGTTSSAYSQVLINSSVTGESELRMGDTDTDAGSISYTNANDTMTFRASASPRMTINSTGIDVTGTAVANAVGIGTSSPSEEIEIASTSPTIRLTDTNDSTYGAVSYNVGALFLTADQTIRLNTDSVERMRIDSAGRVGIGTTSPQKSLHVNSGSTNEVGRFESTDSAAYLAIMDNSTSTSLQGIGSVGNALTLYANNAERMRIDSAGAVTAYNSLRAPIFYDSGNTGNYLDSPTSSVFRLNGSAAVNLAVGGATKLAANASGIDVTGTTTVATGENAWAFKANSSGTTNYSGLWFTATTARLLLRDGSGNIKTMLAANGTNSENVINGNTIWHAGNDGSGSGLDADLLDGQQGSAYLRSNVSATNSVDLRAPVFYDSNNTGYYVNPNGTSVLSNLNATGVNHVFGSSSNTNANVYIRATNTAGAPANTTTLNFEGYEGRGQGTFHTDVSYAGQEWFSGIPYSAGFSAFQIGYDAAGGQAEYGANSIARFTNAGDFQMGTTTVIDSSRNLKNVNSLQFSDTSPTLSENGNYLHIQTASGSTDIGSGNSGWSHFITDRAKFYFNQPLHAVNGFTVYNTSSVLNSAGAYAPAFFDSDNTANYLDSPTSSIFRLNGSSGFVLSANGSTIVTGNSGGIDVTGRVVATEDTDALRLRSSTNGAGVNINFSDHAGGSYVQNGSIRYVHSDGSSYGSGNAFIVESTESNMTFLADGKLMFKEGLYLKPATGTGAGSQIISSDGTFSVPEYIYHQSNTGTYIRYLTNRIITRAGSGAQHDMHSNGNQYFTGKSIFYTGVDVNAGNLEIGATPVIDPSRNLININDVTSTGTVYLDNPNNSSTADPNIDSKGALTSGTAYSYHALFKDGNGNIKGRITHNQYGAQFSNLSDYRAKEDYQEVENATSRLMSIPVRNFQWVGSDLRTDGFLAHEIAEVVPEAVVGEKDAVLEDGTPDYQSIDQSKIVPLLVKTIQELEARLSALENA